MREYAEYSGQVGAAFGMIVMLTTDEGHVYGERLGDYLAEYGEWVREQSKTITVTGRRIQGERSTGQKGTV